MFQKGDYVVYGTRGVCEITDITTVDMDGVKKDRLYYILRPCQERESRIFTPVDRKDTPMRPVLSRSEAAELINQIPGIEELWVSDDKQREQRYKEALKSSDCKQWIGVIKTLYLRRQDRVAHGKKTPAMDEKYLKIAEDVLYAELSVSLGIPRAEMINYLSDRIQKAEGELAGTREL